MSPNTTVDPGSARALTHRITLIAVGVVLVVSLLYGSYHVLAARSAALRATETELQQRASFYAGQISSGFREIQDQGATLARHPPVAGIVRAMADPRGMDPADGSSLSQWKDRLAVIMTNKMEVHPHFTQIRLILAEGDWREVVRVDRRGRQVLRVTEADLQTKGTEPYLERIQAIPETEPYFSRITYNREHGKRDGGPVTIRYVQPVHDAAGAMVGALVFNADYAELLKAARPGVLKNQSVAVVNSEGDYLLFQHGESTARFYHHTDPGFRPLPQAEALGSRLGKNSFADLDDELVYLSTVPMDPSQQVPAQFGVLTFGAREMLESNVKGVLLRHLLITLVLVGFAAGVTHVLASEVGSKFEALHRAVDQSHRRLGWTLRNMADGLVTISSDGIVEEMNPAAEEMFGYTASEVAGESLTRLMFSEDAIGHQSHVSKSRVGPHRTAMALNREIYGRHKSGTKVPIEISVSRAELDGEIKFIGMVRDITERHEAQARMSDLVAQLRRSNEELDQFAYVASHDLKAPLRVIQNASQWLAEDLEPHLTDDTRESLALLKSRATRMEHLLNDLLEHSRIGRIDQAADEVAAPDFVQNLLCLLNVPKGMKLEVDGFSTGRLPQMPLQVVILNLVSNAFKHHDREQGTVRLSLCQASDAWLFTVEDDGPGILPEFHERVFQIFQTLRPRDELEGSGMGLAIVRKHVDLAGGEISLHSDGTRGTTFRLKWPKTSAGSQPEGLAA